MKHVRIILALGCVWALSAVAMAAKAPVKGAGETLDSARVGAIEGILSEKPVGLGRPISDRAAWQQVGALAGYKNLLGDARKAIGKPIPEQPDELYLDFSKTGNRTRWQNVAGQRRGPLGQLVLAECVENQGRFLARIEEIIAAVCAERTWVMPAHDRGLNNFNGKSIEIDLGSSALAWDLATADWLLGEKLKPETRKMLCENVKRRVLDPFLAMGTGAKRPSGWMVGTNNWNAVCIAGCVGAALAQVESRRERAQFVAAGEKYTRNFLAGFTEDGYCSEGLGYWNYGFGRYILFAETVRQATGGKLDLMGLPEVKAPAMFAGRIQIINGVAPAFADCSVRAQPSSNIQYFVSRRLGLGLRNYETIDVRSPGGNLFEAVLYTFPNAASLAVPVADSAKPAALRDWFDKAGILIARPAAKSSCVMGVALKGGHNAEHHNHNDVGSYVVVLGNRPVLLDPGAEVYTARTFSNKRYDSKLLNSFGHPVPLVAGQMQTEGRACEAKILESWFSDEADTLRLDITSAYPKAEGLKTLERTFVYSRKEAGSLSVSDRVEFKSPQAFGTALITAGTWKQIDPRTLVVQEGEASVRVEIDCGGAEFSIQADEIREDSSVKPTRIGINLVKPVAGATVTLKITVGTK